MTPFSVTRLAVRTGFSLFDQPPPQVWKQGREGREWRRDTHKMTSRHKMPYGPWQRTAPCNFVPVRSLDYAQLSALSTRATPSSPKWSKVRRGHGLWSHRTLSPALLGPESALSLARHCTSRDDEAAYCPNLSSVLIKLRCQSLLSLALRLDEFTRVSHALRHVPSTCLPSRSAPKYKALVSRSARRRSDGDTRERSPVDLSPHASDSIHVRLRTDTAQSHLGA